MKTLRAFAPALLAVCFTSGTMQAAEPEEDDAPLGLKAQHTFIPETGELVVYATITNDSKKPQTVCTFYPNMKLELSGEVWALTFRTDFDPVDGAKKTPIVKERLEPVILKPGESVRITYRHAVAGLWKESEKFNNKTQVGVTIMVEESGVLAGARPLGFGIISRFVPFHP